jgi:hypothetical protein
VPTDADGLDTRITYEPGLVGLVCTGSAETAAVGRVESVLAAVHDDAVRRGARQVVVDLTDLEFASSSCLKAFATWLHVIQQLADHARYQVRFVSSARHAWQRRSLGALVAFAADIASVEVGPR